MGYSDQKFYARRFEMWADSGVFTGTYTASSTANALATAATLPKPIFLTRLSTGELLVKTAPTTGQTVLVFLNGTNTFATGTISSTAAVGSTIVLTMTNTASLSTSTVTNTRPNGQTDVGTLTSTTDWRVVGTATAVTVNVSGTATASANSFGAYELFFDAREIVLNT